MMRKTHSFLAGDIKPGMYRLDANDAPEELCHLAEAAGWVCFCVDGIAITNKASFLNVFATTLQFPAYFGHNWDAFEECLIDLPGMVLNGGRGILILFGHSGQFIQANPEEWATVQAIFVHAIKTLKKAGTPMVVLLQATSDEAKGVRLF